jgi:hypothetical protein
MIALFYLIPAALFHIDTTVEVIGAVLGFIFRCLWSVLKLAYIVIAWLAPHVWRGAVLALEFLLLLIEEWRRGPDAQEQREEFFREEEEPPHREEPFHEREEFFREQERRVPPAPDPYRQALALLGLPAEFTQPALKLAYKRAILAAHPDNPAKTGSTKAAQEVNGAYDLLRRSRGWGR